MNLVYKICRAAEWQVAVAEGAFYGSPADLTDGFIHLSTAEQVHETAAKHFAGQENLVIVAFNSEKLVGLRWEPSRGGDLFPHMYGRLRTAEALSINQIPLIEGVHVFREGPQLDTSHLIPPDGANTIVFPQTPKNDTTELGIPAGTDSHSKVRR